jgi:RHS repeat-associated protein
LRNDSTGSGETVEEKLQTRMIRDIVDNEREVIDAKGRTVVQYDYDLLRRRIRSESMDAGQRLMLNDILGQAIRTWDARGHEFRTEYDPLHRPVRRFLRGTDAALSDPRVVHREVLFQKTEYGEGQPNDIALNLRTRVFKQYDSAGVLASVGLNPVINAEEAYDFKGNLLRGTWQLTADYKGIADWAQPVALEAEVFSSSTAYDALNRPVSLVAPDNSEIRSTYSEANLLEQVKARIRGAVQWVTCVENIDYNAKGQRSLIEYGNGVQTRYEYDPIMFRLAQMKTTRGPGEDLQHLSYTYDPTGNVTHIQDAAQQTIFFANTRITPDSDYRYDAVYQLIEATGREHIGQAGQVDHGDPQIYPLPHPNSGEAMQRYTERYAYDAAGNIVSMIHQANGGSWTRRYRYGSDNNHLLAISLPGDDPTGPYAGRYAHNAHGSMTVMPHLPLVVWDFAERMQASSRQVVAVGTPETTYYVYDASGRRVRKVTERQAAQGQTPTRMREHIYLGGFEMFREYGGDGIRIALEKETLHVMDNDHRIALSETKTVDSGSPLTSHVSLLRYQISDHLSSARLELDQTGQVISFEEYHPYGTTSFRATDSTVEVSPKRYRYTGKEKDEETGLYYHGARYYACWLGRWCSADPSGIVDGVGLYAYGRNTPVMRKDSTGRQSETWGQYIKGWIDWALSRSEPTPQQGPSLSSFGDPYRRVPGEEPTPYGFSTIPQEQRPVRELTPDQEAAHLESLRNQPAGINEMTAPARAGDPQDSPARRADSQAMRSGEVGSRPFDATPPGPEQPAAQAPRPQSDFPGRRPIESVNPAGRLPGVENEWIEAAESPEGSWRRTAPERTVLPESASPTPSPAKGIKLRSVDPSMLLELWVAGSDYVFAEDLARRDQILRKATRDQITPEDLSFMNERFGGYPVYDDNGFVTAWKYDLTSFTGFAEWIKEAVRAFGALTDQTPRVYPETA